MEGYAEPGSGHASRYRAQGVDTGVLVASMEAPPNATCGRAVVAVLVGLLEAGREQEPGLGAGLEPEPEPGPEPEPEPEPGAAEVAAVAAAGLVARAGLQWAAGPELAYAALGVSSWLSKGTGATPEVSVEGG